VGGRAIQLIEVIQGDKDGLDGLHVFDRDGLAVRNLLRKRERNDTHDERGGGVRGSTQNL